LGPKKFTTNPLTYIYITHLKLNFRMTTKLFLKHPESKYVTAKLEKDRQVAGMHTVYWQFNTVCKGRLSMLLAMLRIYF